MFKTAENNSVTITLWAPIDWSVRMLSFNSSLPRLRIWFVMLRGLSSVWSLGSDFPLRWSMLSAWIVQTLWKIKTYADVVWAVPGGTSPWIILVWVKNSLNMVRSWGPFCQAFRFPASVWFITKNNWRLNRRVLEHRKAFQLAIEMMVMVTLIVPKQDKVKLSTNNALRRPVCSIKYWGQYLT